ncbi:hypothetical protein TELCIR_22597, partial [Teladorsagia circumcincta]
MVEHKAMGYFGFEIHGALSFGTENGAINGPVGQKVDILLCLHRVSPAGTIGELVHRSHRKLEPFVST